MCSKEPNTTETLKKLKADLQNGPYHCFGIHDNCSPDFCTTVRKNQQQNEGNCERTESIDDDADELSGIAADQVRPKKKNLHVCYDIYSVYYA